MSFVIKGSVDSARKKFSILTTRQSSGRSSEISWVLLESLKWDPCFKQVTAELLQVKVSKTKLFPFVAGTVCLGLTELCRGSVHTPG